MNRLIWVIMGPKAPYRAKSEQNTASAVVAYFIAPLNFRVGASNSSRISSAFSAEIVSSRSCSAIEHPPPNPVPTVPAPGPDPGSGMTAVDLLTSRTNDSLLHGTLFLVIPDGARVERNVREVGGVLQRDVVGLLVHRDDVGFL